jgi:hypothetical protein
MWSLNASTNASSGTYAARVERFSQMRKNNTTYLLG